ncbi:MAG: JAB domain-containing protein [Deltaproteobacteria bacterium]|nr:JAB domain-containing protein [Deltaproteobacteria bacterium]
MERIYSTQFPGTKYRIELVREGTGESTSKSQKPLMNAKGVYQYIRAGLENKDREFFISILFDTRLVPLGVNLIAIGGLNSAMVYPREVFKAAVLASAASLVLAHNHPSGNPNPSKEDIDLTNKLMQAGNILNIPIYDHIIVGRNCYHSMKENGDM